MKPTLPTNYVDDIPNPSVEGMRRYQMIYNSDNTVSFKDVTPYDQTGSDFGAGDINLTNEAVNQSADAGKIIDDPDTAEATTEEGYIAGVQLFNHVSQSLTWKFIDSITPTSTTITIPNNAKEIKIVLKTYLSSKVQFSTVFSINDITDGDLGIGNASVTGALTYDSSNRALTFSNLKVLNAWDKGGWSDLTEYTYNLYYR